MGFSEKLYEYLEQKSSIRGWQSDFAKLSGMNQSALSKIISKETKNPELPSISAIVDALGDDFLVTLLHEKKSYIRRASPNSPEEVVQGSELPRVPVLGEAGAGSEVDVFNAVPEMFLSILPRYYRKDMVCMKVAGDSMAPTIGKGDYVGIVPFDGTLHEGAIYLVDLPPFGRVVKRVRMGSNGEIILLSDNPSYGERIIPFDGYDQIIIGQVYWIMQKCWED